MTTHANDDEETGEPFSDHKPLPPCISGSTIGTVRRSEAPFAVRPYGVYEDGGRLNSFAQDDETDRPEQS